MSVPYSNCSIDCRSFSPLASMRPLAFADRMEAYGFHELANIESGSDRPCARGLRVGRAAARGDGLSVGGRPYTAEGSFPRQCEPDYDARGRDALLSGRAFVGAVPSRAVHPWREPVDVRSGARGRAATTVVRHIAFAASRHDGRACRWLFPGRPLRIAAVRMVCGRQLLGRRTRLSRADTRRKARRARESGCRLRNIRRRCVPDVVDVRLGYTRWDGDLLRDDGYSVGTTFFFRPSVAFSATYSRAAYDLGLRDVETAQLSFVGGF